MNPSRDRPDHSEEEGDDEFQGNVDNDGSRKEDGFSLDLDSLLRAGMGVDLRGRTTTPTCQILSALLYQPALRQLASEQPERFVRCLAVLITRIDEVINRQLNAVLHHPTFQRLESSWRGLKYLHSCLLREERDDIKLKVLNVTWQELEQDFHKQREFDQSFLFKTVYENEFGQAGGYPFGVLIGDFEIRPRPSREHTNDDLDVLRSISHVAAAAFCPFIAGISPAMFDFDDFSRLERTVDLDRYFRDKSFFNWEKLRSEEDSRFIGLALPRTLMRLPWEDDSCRIDGFRFKEEVELGSDINNYLWGNAAYAFAGVLLRSFNATGWFVDTRGVEIEDEFLVDGGGLVPGLPVQSFATDRPDIAPKPSTDVVVSESLERTLSELGFIPLCDCPDTSYAAFFSNRSIQKPGRYNSPEANASARMSTMLQYMFCVSRFAHFLKVMARDLIGSLESDKLQRHLNNWIADYICDADSSPRTKTERPLESGRVTLVREPGKAGSYQCRIELKPHFELEELVAALTFNTRLSAPQIN